MADRNSQPWIKVESSLSCQVGQEINNHGTATLATHFNEISSELDGRISSDAGSRNYGEPAATERSC